MSADPSLPRVLRALARRLGLRLSVLDPQQVDAARALLYRVYFEEQGWDPPPNPSNLRADHAHRRFTDDFDHTAVWIGAFAGERLMGCLRILDPRRVGALELARYIELPRLPGRVGEANRVAVARGHRRGAVTLLLSMAGAACARRMGMQQVLGTATERIYQRSARHVGWRSLGVQFRYHPSDPAPVRLLGFDLRWRALARLLVGGVAGRVAHGVTRSRRRSISAPGK